MMRMRRNTIKLSTVAKKKEKKRGGEIQKLLYWKILHVSFSLAAELTAGGSQGKCFRRASEHSFERTHCAHF